MVTLTITGTETGTVVDDPEEALLQLLSNIAVKTKAEIKVSLKEIDNALQHSSSTEKNSLQQMASLLQLLSPLEYHNVAKQAMVVHLVDESNEWHFSICLLLCCHALHHIPLTPATLRWKRPQSLLCETIHLYQHYTLPNVELWTDHVVPSCLSLKLKLPNQAAHDNITAAIIGTTSILVEESPPDTEKLHSCIQPLLINVGYSVLIPKPSNNVEEDCDNELLAGMDMTFSALGMAKLARLSWTNNVATIQPQDCWIHITAILVDGDWEEGITWLDALLLVKVEGVVEQLDSQIMSPIPILQLLGNHRISLAMSQRSDQEAHKQVQQRMMEVLKRYTEDQQVSIVQELLTTCPQPSMKAKWLDLLRPLAIHHPHPPQSLWDLLDELLVTMDTNTSDLLDTIELYVAVLTMVTFYMLVKHVKPPCHNLGVIQRVATTVQVLPRHGTDSFRLNLLEMALEHVLLVLRTMDGTSEELC